MNQYTAPMPGHFMWHLFSIPLLGTKSWPGAAALWPISLSQGWGMQSALGFISFELTTAWRNMPLSCPRSLYVLDLPERVQNKEKKQLQLLYRRAVMHFTVSWCIMVSFLLSSFANITLPLLFWSIDLLFSSVSLLACMPFSLFSWDNFSPISLVSLSLFSSFLAVVVPLGSH